MGTLTKLPNILLIIVDQDRATQHYPAGWEEENLPNMTLLKQNGLSFRNGFCNTCMCSPSRSTLFTGLHPAQHGVTDTLTFAFRASVNETELDNTLPNMAKMLRANYETHFRGKWHMSKGGLDNVHPAKSLMQAEVAIFGFDGWIPPDAGEDTKLQNFGGGYASHDQIYVNQAIEYIKDYQTRQANGETDKPFFLVLSLVNPHDVLSYPLTYEDGGYSDDDLESVGIPLPPTVSEKLALNYKPQAQVVTKAGLANGLGELSNEQMQLNYLNFYARLQMGIDKQIGQVLDCFYGENGANQLAEETLIVRLADHGEMGMAHGGLRQKSYNVYEESLRIPYIFSNPVLYGGGYETDQLASLIDMVPTLAGFLNEVDSSAGIEPPSNARGVDLSDVLCDPTVDEAVQTEIVFTYDDVRAGQPIPLPAANRIRCIRQQDWKFARYFHADSSYPDAFEMYYIKGVHKELTETLSEKAFKTGVEKLQQKALGQPFSDTIFEAFLELFMRFSGYETVNLANTDPAGNRYVQQMIDIWAGIYSADDIVGYLADTRTQLAEALQAQEQGLWIRN